MRAVLSAVALYSFAGCGGRPLQARDAGADAVGTPDGACDAGAPDAAAPPAIPLGVYASCTSTVVEGASTADGAGGTISLTAGGGVLTVEVRNGFLALGTGSLAFTPLSAAAAVAVPGQTYEISNLPCTMSIIQSGALALENDELALTLVGQGCGQPISGTLRCTVPMGATGTLAPPALPPCSPSGQPGCGCAPPAFAVGSYGPCTTSVPAFEGGTVIVAQGDGVVTAALGGLTSIEATDATLRFIATTQTTATIVPGQTWDVSVPGAFVPTVPDTMTVTSGTIVVDGDMLFAFVSGTDDAHNDVRESFHCGAGN